MNFKRLLIVCAGTLAFAPVWADTSSDAGLTWLQRMSAAAQNLNYTGVFTYQSQGRSETSRITHVVDATGQREKLETLDGTPREVIRLNNEVHCFLPADRLLIIDHPNAGLFPGRWLNALNTLLDSYNVRLGEVGRVAGLEAQLVFLEPRDDMRYGHQLWADTASGLLLKARMINDRAESVEQFAFSQVKIGEDIDRDTLKPRYAKLDDWRVISANGQEVNAADLKWQFRDLPPGYRKLSAVRRLVRRDGSEAYHAVFTDGLATISAFVEAIGGKPFSPTHKARAGSTNIYKRQLGDYQVTMLGEVPMQALRRIAEGMELVDK